MNRIQKLAQEARDAQALYKFWLYCKAAGLGPVEAEEDRYYTVEQEDFFRKYEEQLFPELYALAAVGIEERSRQ